MVLNMGLTDLDDPAAIRQYFTSLYQLEDTDRRHIQALRKGLDYPKTAQAFRMIDDNTVTVLVPYGSPNESEQRSSRHGRRWRPRPVIYVNCCAEYSPIPSRCINTRPKSFRHKGGFSRRQCCRTWDCGWGNTTPCAAWSLICRLTVSCFRRWQ